MALRLLELMNWEHPFAPQGPGWASNVLLGVPRLFAGNLHGEFLGDFGQPFWLKFLANR
jgi:hypothetical protein